MTVRWEDLRASIAQMLDDTARGETDNPSWSNDELKSYTNFALTAFADHTAQTKSKTYEAATADLSSANLPEDLIQIGPVWFPNRVLVSPVYLEPGQTFADEEVSTSSQPVGYYRWPDDVLNLTQAVPQGESLVLFYWAYWDTVEQDGSIIKIPKWAEEAIVWHCLSRAMAKPGVQAASLGQWKQRQDSGTPEHNPGRRYAEYCFEQFDAILARHARQDRTGWESRVS